MHVWVNKDFNAVDILPYFSRAPDYSRHVVRVKRKSL